MSVEPDLNEITPSNDPVDEPFTEAEFPGEGGIIHLNEYEDRYTCFWYTDKSLHTFIKTVESFVDEKDISLERVYLEDEGNIFGADTDYHGMRDKKNLQTASYDNVRRQNDLEEASYFEVNIDSMNVYWAEQSAPDDENSLPAIIKIASSTLDPNPIRPLYMGTVPDNVSNTEHLVDSVERYLQQ